MFSLWCLMFFTSMVEPLYSGQPKELPSCFVHFYVATISHSVLIKGSVLFGGLSLQTSFTIIYFISMITDLYRVVHSSVSLDCHMPNMKMTRLGH